MNKYLNVERKLELEFIICFFLNPSLGPSTTDFAHRSAIADLFRDGGGGGGCLESAIRKEIPEINKRKTGAVLKQSRNKSVIGEVEDKIYLLTAPYVNLFRSLHLYNLYKDI